MAKIINKISNSTEIVTLNAEKLALNVELVNINKISFPSDLNRISNNNTLSNEEKIDRKKIIEERYNNKISEIKNLISIIDTKIEDLKTNNPIENIKKKAKKEENKIKNTIKQSQDRNYKLKSYPKIKTIDIINSISVIITSLISSVNIINAQIENEVDRVNEVIEQIKTKEDILNATKQKESIEAKIIFNEKRLEIISKIIDLLQILTNVIKPLLLLINALPPLVITGSIITLFNKLEKILTNASTILSIANALIRNIIIDLGIQKQRLSNINNLLDNNISQLSSDDISNIINSSGLGYVAGSDYKNYKFYIKEEEDINKVVKGNKRRYAVAVDNYNIEKYKSNYSFTLNPQILIDELIYKIDKENN
jgi:hypothetical protein